MEDYRILVISKFHVCEQWSLMNQDFSLVESAEQNYKYVFTSHFIKPLNKNRIMQNVKQRIYYVLL